MDSGMKIPDNMGLEMVPMTSIDYTLLRIEQQIDDLRREIAFAITLLRELVKSDDEPNDEDFFSRVGTKVEKRKHTPCSQEEIEQFNRQIDDELTKLKRAIPGWGASTAKRVEDFLRGKGLTTEEIITIGNNADNVIAVWQEMNQ